MLKRALRRVSYFYALIFSSPPMMKIHLLLFHLSLRGMGILNYQDARVSGEENFVRRVLPKLIESDCPTMIDVGARHGSYVRRLSAHFAGARIHAFEPHPASFEKLSAVASPNITCYRKALDREARSLTLYDRGDQTGSGHATVFEGVISDLHRQPSTSFTVESDTIDGFAEAQGLDFIDFVKIDTEGDEYNILLGAKKLLSRGAIGCLQFEFNEMNVISRVFFRDFRVLLEERYRLYRLLPKGLVSLGDVPLETELFGFQNCVAVLKSRVAALS